MLLSFSTDIDLLIVLIKTVIYFYCSFSFSKNIDLLLVFNFIKEIDLLCILASNK